MPQAKQIDTQGEQRVTRLRAQRATQGTSRELALDRGDYAFDQSSAPAEPTRKCMPHLGAHGAHPPNFLPALGGTHTVRRELLSDIGVIPLAVELGVGQRQPNTRLRGIQYEKESDGTGDKR